jgi:hypothetical protein
MSGLTRTYHRVIGMTDKIDALEAELERLRTPTDTYGRTYLGITIGEYIQGCPESGYGHSTLYRIRELRRLISANRINDLQITCRQSV